jgi:hypothetical protein
MKKHIPKRGRPPKPDGKRRESELRIRLTAAERSLLDDAAGKAAGTSTWAREVLLAAAGSSIRAQRSKPKKVGDGSA